MHIGCLHLIVAIETLHKVRTHRKLLQECPKGWRRETPLKGLKFLFAVASSTTSRSGLHGIPRGAQGCDGPSPQSRSLATLGQSLWPGQQQRQVSHAKPDNKIIRSRSKVDDRNACVVKLDRYSSEVAEWSLASPTVMRL